MRTHGVLLLVGVLAACGQDAVRPHGSAGGGSGGHAGSGGSAGGSGGSGGTGGHGGGGSGGHGGGGSGGLGGGGAGGLGGGGAGGLGGGGAGGLGGGGAGGLGGGGAGGLGGGAGGLGGGGAGGRDDLPVGLDERPSNKTCLGPTPEDGDGYGLTRAFSSVKFTNPVLITQAPGQPDWFYVVEQRGYVRRFENIDDVDSSELVLDIHGSVKFDGEMGLLGLAFHPDFEDNGEIFVDYVFEDGMGYHSRISRFTSDDGGASFDEDNEDILLEVDQPDKNHKGGMLVFGPDGYLYIGFGDGGGGGDQYGNSQDPDTLLAKILRIDPDGDAPYAIPDDNPWADGKDGVAEMFAWGMRNPWRFSFDRKTGDLWAGDVGQAEREEIDLIESGKNYGWNIREGTICYKPNCDDDGLTDPVLDYDHDEGQSITGGYVYRGSKFPDLAGLYIFGDYVTGKLWKMDPSDAMPEKSLLDDTGLNLSSFGEDADGELYALDYFGGGVYALSSDAPKWDPPDLLSDTGCVDADDPTKPASGLVPYDVNVAFWSDGADKQRWLALPDDASATVDEDGHVVLPPGSVLMKEFQMDGDRLETRLLWRDTLGSWHAAAYRWNDAGTDADLVADGDTIDLGDQTWEIPSSTDCMRCHTAAAGHSLGMEVQQLNRSLTYPGGKEGDQLATLKAVGLLKLDDDPRDLDKLPTSEDDPVSDRARAWIHANCSQCHRPGGTGRGPLDARYGPADQLGVCDVKPTAGDLGIQDALLIAPGSAARSVLLQRVDVRDGKDQMPPLGSRVIDDDAVQLLTDWIDGMKQCP